MHDPRSGEILETHINWYHNVMSLLYNWYIVQAGAIDPGARKPMFDDELMGDWYVLYLPTRWDIH